jgi:O-antigen ligase
MKLGTWVVDGFSVHPTHAKFASVFVVIFAMALFSTVAVTNLAVLGLVLTAPFAWREFWQTQETIEASAKVFLGLIVAICAWDLFTNLYAGFDLISALKALLHDMRTLGFILLLWAVFANPYVARIAFWSICASVFTLASVNLFFTLSGRVPQGEYFTTGFMHMSHLSHMYGQALVGLVFVLAQLWLVRPSLSWRVSIPIAILVLSLFLASERRTGWLMLAAGFGVWALLNARRLFVGKYKWWLLFALVAALGVVASSDVVHRRMGQAMVEFNQYLSMTPQERATVTGSVSIRLQFASTMIELVKQSNWWIGVGSLGFSDAFHVAAARMGVTPEAGAAYNWGNPHNEYLYILATKGVVGLTLYLAIFVQACRVAWGKADEVQRVGLTIFVILFMISITSNSMIIDMEEGHFTMLILLIFLAPKSLQFSAPKAQS